MGGSSKVGAGETIRHTYSKCKFQATQIVLLADRVSAAVLQWWQLITSLVVIQPRQLVAFQPAGPLASTPRLGIAPARLPEDQRQTRPRLRHRQRRRPLFAPASPPRPGTTPPAATAPCGGATPASSSPGTRPALPRSYPASGTPRSGAPPSPPAPIPPAASTERHWRGDNHTSTCPPPRTVPPPASPRTPPPSAPPSTPRAAPRSPRPGGPSPRRGPSGGSTP